MAQHQYLKIVLLHIFLCISYAGMSTDTLRISTYLKKADSLCSVHPDSALPYSQKAVDAAPFIDIPIFVSKIYKTHAKVFYFKSLYDSSAYFLKKAIEHVPEDEAMFRARLYDNYGSISMMQNRFDTALYYMQMAFNINKKNNFKKGLMTNYANFGSLFRRFGAYDIAMKYIYEGLPIAEELKDTTQILKYLQTIGIIYGAMNKEDLSIKYCKQAFDYALATKNYKRASELANSIALSYKSLKNYSEAIRYFQLSYNYARMLNFTAMEAVSQVNIAQYFVDINQLDSAMFYLSKAYVITKKYNYLNINTSADILYGQICIKRGQFNKASEYLLNAIEGKYKAESDVINSAYYYLIDLYEARGNYTKAYEYYKIYSQRRDSTLNSKKTEEIANLRMQYELNKKKEQMEAEAKEKEAKLLAETKRNKLIRNITIVGFFVLIIIVLLVVIVFRYRQKQKLMNLKNEIDLYRQRLMTQQVNPHFIFNTLNSIQYFVYNNKKEESMEFISQFAQLMRLSLHNSQNDIVALQDEIEALRLYLELERTRLDNRFDYNIEIDPAIDIENQLVPSFLIQPLVENSIKHGILKNGNKGYIETKIILSEDRLIYTVMDNGIGFKQSKAIQKDTGRISYGLELTKKRISLLGILNNKLTDFIFADIKDKKGECKGAKVELVIPSMLRLT